MFDSEHKTHNNSVKSPFGLGRLLRGRPLTAALGARWPDRHASRAKQGGLMKTTLGDGEMIIKEGTANLQKNIETVGGKLYLTNQRLVFEAHKHGDELPHTEIGVSGNVTLTPIFPVPVKTAAPSMQRKKGTGDTLRYPCLCRPVFRPVRLAETQRSHSHA
jgi:hypothetical protein